MELWHNFFLGEPVASAALIGLVFVGVSINLTDIVTTPALAFFSLHGQFCRFVVAVE